MASCSKNRTLLYISPYFPPSGRVGAKRALSLVRRLPALGWDPVVLAAPPLNASVDLDSLALVPPELTVSYGFQWFLRPLFVTQEERIETKKELREKPKRSRISFSSPLDKFLLDLPGALFGAAKLVARHKPEVIVVNAFPWTGMLVGAALARWAGCRLILDMRDPWSLNIQDRKNRSQFVQRVAAWLESFCFSRAEHVILNCEGSRREYESNYKRDFEMIRNGFDRDILGIGGERAEDFEVHYFGPRSRLADSETVEKAFEVFRQETGAKSARLVYYGRGSHKEFAETRARVPLRETGRALSRASVLVLDRGPEDRLQLPLKLYDYLSTGQPILAFSDHDELNSILADTGAGHSVAWKDWRAGADRLKEIYLGRASTLNPERVESYSADMMAEKFAKLLS